MPTPYLSSIAEDVLAKGFSKQDVLALAREVGVSMKWPEPSARAKALAAEMPFPTQLLLYIPANVYFWTAPEADVLAYLASHGVEAQRVATRADAGWPGHLTATKHTLREAFKLSVAHL